MNKLVIISGPSGVGKGTVVKELVEKYKNENKKLYLSISCTTRNPREGEKEGVNYYFISQEEFANRVEKNDFLEYNQYGTGKFYGTPKSTVVNYLNNGYDVILEIDVNGYKQIKENYPDSVGIFILPPSVEELESRLRKRNTETEENIIKRLQTAKDEIMHANEYDFNIVNQNGKTAEACEEIYNIMSR